MTPTQVELVQISFLDIAEMQEKVAGLFYTKLFELNGDLRKLFKEDMSKQKQKLMNSFSFIVTGLDTLELRRAYIQNLGRAHVSYNVCPEDFRTVGEALLSTLETVFGNDWTPELADAWSAAYKTITDIMIDFSYPKSQSPSIAS